MSPLVAGLFGGVVAVGVLLTVLGVRGVPAGDAPRRRLAPDVDRLNLRLAVAAGAAVLVYAATGWPVGALAGAAFGWSAPTLVGAKAARQREIDRIEGVARWAEQLRDTMTAAAGLHEAIGVTARVAPLAIRPAVEELATGLQSERLPALLRRFASRVANPAGDQVAVALLLASERHGARLADVLDRVAAAARAEATLRLRIEAQRARAASQARLVSGVIASVVAIYVVLNRSYLAPFGTPLGQTVLAAVCGLWFLSFWALVRLASVEPGSRLLAVDP
jgi:tight adherence protein B